MPHLSDGAQQLPVAEHDDQEGHDEAEDEQADDVGDVVRRLGLPVDGAGGPGALGAVAAPAEERRHGPGEGVEPGQCDAQGDLHVVGGVGLGGGHHGAVALVGEDGEGDEGHDACGGDRTLHWSQRVQVSSSFLYFTSHLTAPSNRDRNVLCVQMFLCCREENVPSL